MWLVFNYFNAWILTKITKKIGTRRLRKRKLKFFGLKCETIITKTSLVFWKSLFFSRSRFIIQVLCPLSLTLFTPHPCLSLSIYLSIHIPPQLPYVCRPPIGRVEFKNVKLFGMTGSMLSTVKKTGINWIFRQILFDDWIFMKKPLSHFDLFMESECNAA